jgi:hypothetical protein
MAADIADQTPGIELFPEFRTLYDLIAPEVEGLSDAQLDFRSARWEWAGWSIRNQLSHMASLIYGWLLVRWGDVLFPAGDHGVDNLQHLTGPGFDRRMDDELYWQLPVILARLREAIGLAQRVLEHRSVAFLRHHTYERDFPPHWQLMIQAHPVGVTRAPEPGKLFMTLEATFRHMYFEEITHLFNIQRLKRAQNLPTVVDVPRVGYWVVEGWDRSRP